jgi:hypothetical protein
VLAVGWYLMVPPLDTTERVNTGAPFTKWTQLAVYDSPPVRQKVLFGVQNAREHKPATAGSRFRLDPLPMTGPSRTVPLLNAVTIHGFWESFGSNCTRGSADFNAITVTT